MYVKVMMVGLADELAKRLRIAFNLQAAHGYTVGYVNGFGLQADLLVADLGDANALTAVHRAVQTGRKVLAFGDSAGLPAGVTVMSRDSTVADLKVSAQHLLNGLRHQRPDAAATQRRDAVPVIVRLASGSIDAHANLKLVSDDITLIVRRGASRVLAPSHSDILAAADRLLTSNWRVEVLESFDPALVRGWMSRSLDSFLVRAVRVRGAVLPRFPDTSVRLLDWPDLAESSDPLAAQLAGMLTRGLATIEHLIERTGSDRNAVCNLLWAFRAAGLLAVSEGVAYARSPVAVAASADRRGLLARIARRFGMGVALP